MTGEAALPAGTVVRTPILGIAYRAKSPEAEPFVQVGSIVAAGDALCLVEAMKMFSEITAPVAGTVLAINFEDGALVEHNAPLFVIG
jgi:acetyl-CoA carboxylase biotin carboxyl carrier protein